MESVGANGLFQKIAAYSCIGGIQAFTLVFFNIAIFEMSPHFKCNHQG
jgi:hypothetical protein